MKVITYLMKVITYLMKVITYPMKVIPERYVREGATKKDNPEKLVT
jgi:hypothetical protein